MSNQQRLYNNIVNKEIEKCKNILKLQPKLITFKLYDIFISKTQSINICIHLYISSYL